MVTTNDPGLGNGWTQRILARAFACVIVAGAASACQFTLGDPAAAPQQAVTEPVIVTPERSIDELSAWETFQLCKGYARIRDFNRFDQCFSTLEQRIGDGTLREAGTGGREWNRSATLVLMQELRAGSLLDRGRLEAAEQAALAARTAAYDRPNYVEFETTPRWLQQLSTLGLYGNADNIFEYLRLRPEGLLAVIKARQGDSAAARNYLELLQSYDNTGFAGQGQSFIWRHWVAKAHIVLGDFEQAYAVLAQEPRIDTGDEAYDALVALNYVDPDGDDVLVDVGAVSPLPGRYLINVENAFMRYRSALETGRTAEARTGYDIMLSDPALQGHAVLHFRVLRDRGRIAAVDGDIDEAIGRFEQAIQLLESRHSTAALADGTFGPPGDVQALYGNMVSAQMAENRPELAFQFAARGKLRAVVDLLAARRDFRLDDTAQASRIRAILARLDDIDRQSARLVQTGTVNRKQLVEEIAELRRELSGISGSVSDLVTVAPVDPVELRSRLGGDEALVSYFHHADDLFAFLLTGDSLEAVELDGQGLVAAIADLRLAIQTPRRRTVYRRHVQAMYRRLVRPLEEKLDVSRLIVVAHGPLLYLPFGALSDGRKDLLDRYAIRMIPTVRGLWQPERPASSSELLAVGGPDLPGAAAETAVITALWGGGRVLLDDEATEAAFRQLSPTAGYVHLASRGFLDFRDPMDSAILLSPDGEDDGRLTVSELFDLRLNASLVTLSATETALGDQAGGGDVVALATAFRFAGAQALVVSHWPAPEEATNYLMQRFYAHLRSETEPEALRQAQRETAARFRHPYYWSGFVLFGGSQSARDAGPS